LTMMIDLMGGRGANNSSAAAPFPSHSDINKAALRAAVIAPAHRGWYFVPLQATGRTERSVVGVRVTHARRGNPLLD